MPGIELWWLGQSGFRVRALDGGPTVFLDPYLLLRENRTWQAPLDPAGLAQQADLVLVSHEHTDHYDRPSLKAAVEAGAHCTLVLPRPLAASAPAELGLDADHVIGAQPDESITFQDVRVHPLPARHGVNVADSYNFGEALSDGQVRYLGYVLEIGGVRLYHAGDCIPYEGQEARLRALRPQVALLPINGRDFYRESERNIVGNMNEREATRLATDMGAHVLVPMHWELLPHNRGFPGDLLSYVSTTFPELSVLVLGRGARFVYTPPPA